LHLCRCVLNSGQVYVGEAAQRSTQCSHELVGVGAIKDHWRFHNHDVVVYSIHRRENAVVVLHDRSRVYVWDG
jgi:hypothetical protein